MGGHGRSQDITGRRLSNAVLRQILQ